MTPPTPFEFRNKDLSESTINPLTHPPVMVPDRDRSDTLVNAGQSGALCLNDPRPEGRTRNIVSLTKP